MLFIVTIDYRFVLFRGKIEKKNSHSHSNRRQKRVESIDVKVPLTLEFR